MNPGGSVVITAKRRATWNGKKPQGLKNSPLLDLPPMAIPGLCSRVMVGKRMACRLDSMHKPFEKHPNLGDSECEDGLVDEMVEMEGGCTRPLLLAACVALMPAFQYGFNNGDMNTAAGVIRKDLGIPIGMGVASDTVWGMNVSIFCIGALVGCSAGSSLAERLGRRRAVLMISFVSVLGSLLSAASVLPGGVSVGPLGIGTLLMMAGRIVSGLASGAATVVVPMNLGRPHLKLACKLARSRVPPSERSINSKTI